MPQDLRHAHFVNLDHAGMMIKALNKLGLGLTEENFPLLTESYLVMWELVRQGVAIGILDAHIGDADPIVRRVLPDFQPFIFSIWLRYFIEDKFISTGWVLESADIKSENAPMPYLACLRTPPYIIILSKMLHFDQLCAQKLLLR